jgi:hypothetical protein
MLIVAVVFLVRNQGAYRSSLSQLRTAQNRLEALNTRQPFPSPENVEISKQNLTLLRDKYQAVESALRRDQLKAEAIEPAGFARMLEATILRIRAKAATAGISLPAEAGLGFKDYAAGKLPPNDPAIMERLVVQIRGLEDLIGLMADAKVLSIDTLERDAFELRADALAAPEPEVRGRGRGSAAMGRGETAAAPSQVGGLPIPPGNELYSIERFAIGITGRESAIWDVINRLVSSRVVYSIVDFSFENTRSDLGRPVDMKARLTAMLAAARQPGGTGAASAAGIQPTLESLSREERVVGGREPIKARFVIDMYRFKDTGAVKELP